MRAEEKEEARERGEEWSPKGGVERGRGDELSASRSPQVRWTGVKVTHLNDGSGTPEAE